MKPSSDTFAICATMFFCVLALGILFTGDHVDRVTVAYALLLGGIGQFIGQDRRMAPAATVFSWLALFTTFAAVFLYGFY